MKYQVGEISFQNWYNNLTWVETWILESGVISTWETWCRNLGLIPDFSKKYFTTDEFPLGATKLVILSLSVLEYWNGLRRFLDTKSS